MTEDTSRLYIYVKDWKKHQPRADKPNLPWIRLQTSLLGDDAWLDLEPADSKLLVTIWLLSQRYGHGRVKANLRWLQSQANLPVSNRYRGLERLIEAGLVSLSSTKAPPVEPTKGGTEERSTTYSLEEKEKENARAAHAENGGARAQRKKAKCPEHNAELIGSHDYWQCPAPACRYSAASRWVGGDPTASILPDLGRL